jgi:NAD(P)-dependent dehydrogenase (short-subunit alcohol dehydrogenase family)
MAREGATVVVTDRDLDAARRTADRIVGAGGRAVAARLDVTDDAGIVALIGDVVERYGRIDILHNHAGVQVAGSVEEIDGASFDRSWAVNVHAQFIACQSVLPIMKRQRGGVILNTSSNSGVFLDRGMTAYITSKAASITMTRQIALDVARYGIRVNALCPGWVDTPFNEPYTKQLGGRQALENAIANIVPMGRFATTEEIAEVILFLVSDRSSYMTGHALVADGGESLAGGTNAANHAGN